jgi:hypothetical protein
MSFLPPGTTPTVLLLRALLLVLPCAALAVPLPEVPHWAVIVLAVVSAGVWATDPDNIAGAVALVVVAGWWTAHGVVDWHLLVVAVLLLTAHVVGTVLAHGPATLPVHPHLAALWLRRGLLTLLPLPVTYAAVVGLDADRAPSWTWPVAAVLVAGLLVATARLTRVEAE